MRNKDLQTRQEQRQALFPKDRIAFVRSSVYEDVKVFDNYVRGYISIDTACRLIAEHNYLPEVTPEQFLNELRLCGWDRDYVLKKEMESLLKGGDHADL